MRIYECDRALSRGPVPWFPPRCPIFRFTSSVFYVADYRVQFGRGFSPHTFDGLRANTDIPPLESGTVIRVQTFPAIRDFEVETSSIPDPWKALLRYATDCNRWSMCACAMYFETSADLFAGV